MRKHLPRIVWLLASLTLLFPAELIHAASVTFEAESGALGPDWAVSNSASPAYITITTGITGTGATNPTNASRVATYTVTFPSAGTYQLYARVLVGPGGYDNDSMFYGNGFGTQDPAVDSDWVMANNLSVVGFNNSSDVVTGGGSLGNGVWKWINLSQFTSQPGFAVPAGNLTQTFQIGGRESGLNLDKFVFGTAGYNFTVFNLDNGTDGSPLPPQTTTIDTTRKYQTIEGLGGATCFWVGNLTGHPYKMEIYTNAFAGLNLSMLRLGDWWRYDTRYSISTFDSAANDVVANANRVLGHPVQVYMSSWAPPAFLKSNGQTGNGGTLATNADGTLNYAGFAQYWYDSIQAYRSNGISPQWISIQNEPDWVAGYDSCIFNPTEGIVNGTNYASYSKALDAVYNKLSTNLPSPPKILAPEVVHIAYNDLANYAATLNGNSFYGINYHLYGGNNSDLSSSTNIFPNKPHFMTEFGVDDLMGAATLIHNCLTLGQDSGFNFWSLVWPVPGGGLIQVENGGNPSSWTNAPGAPTESHGWYRMPSYWAMKHFSYFINPGFKRVSATDTDGNVLSSAYLSPDGLRLVAVLINTSATASSAMEFNLGTFNFGRSSVYQTAGTNTVACTNTFLSLGSLASPQTLPPQSVTTVVLDKIITVGAASNPSPVGGSAGVSLNSTLIWTPGSNAVTHAVYFGTSSNAVANATPSSPEFQGVAWTNQFSLSAATWGTTYFWRVDEIAYSNTNQGPVWSLSTAPAVQLPSPWQSQDIGVASGQTGAVYTNGVFTMTGIGADIWSTSDAFRFAYLAISGNCTIIARVTSVQNVHEWSKAGIMIRESLSASAVNAYIAVTPGNGVTWQYRSSTGGTSANTNTTGLNAPYWVKLVRSGNTFTGYRSPDGVTWTQQGSSQTITMASTAYVGLALTSHNSSSVCTATFDNVTAPGWPLLPGAPGGLTASAGDAQVALSWPAVSGASSYNVKSATTNDGSYAVFTNVAATVCTNTGLLNGTTYFYVVSALNIAGESTNSVPASATPQAPPTLMISQAGPGFMFSWPVGSAGFTLESATNLESGNWTAVTSAVPQMSNGQWSVTLPSLTNSDPTFYRLAK
jgi:glucuronoarabinoxylan endo-1,4-beta-xylanase